MTSTIGGFARSRSDQRRLLSAHQCITTSTPGAEKIARSSCVRSDASTSDAAAVFKPSERFCEAMVLLQRGRRGAGRLRASKSVSAFEPVGGCWGVRLNMGQ